MKTGHFNLTQASGTGRPAPVARLPVLLCLFLSGVAGLMFETVWARAFGLILGNSLLGVSAVAGLFLGGLGVGAAFAGRLAPAVHRPLVAYAVLEGLVGLWGLGGILLLPALPGLISRLFPASSSGDWGPVLGRGLAAPLFLLPPTLLMGATLPLLAEAFARVPRFLPALGLLYGTNTVGAFVGVAAAGFVFLPLAGSARTTLIAASAELVVFVLAGLLGRAHGTNPGARVPAPASSPAPPIAPFAPVGLSGLFFLTGALALASQIAWTRALSLVLGSSTYTFSVVLAAFLLGGGLGSLFWKIVGRVPREPLRAYGWLWLAAGSALLASVAVLDRTPEIYIRFYAGWSSSRAGALSGLFLLSALVVFPTAVLLGLHFPLTGEIFRASGTAPGRAVGRAFFWNSAGALCGSLAAGFLFLPKLGTGATLRVAATLALLLGGVLLAGKSRRAKGIRLAAVAALVAVAPWILLEGPGLSALLRNQGIYRRLTPEAARELPAGEFAARMLDFGGRRCLFLQEGSLSTVAVWYGDGNLSLTVGGKVDASSGDMETQVLLGQLPVLFHPHPRSALVIGYGSGITANSVLARGGMELDVVEIEPAVLSASRFFRPWTGRLASGGEVTVLREDGRTALSYGRKRYDVIVSEPSNPWISGVNTLFTEEFYRTVRSRLNPGGIFCQWVQAYEMTAATHGPILRSLQSAFPHFVVFEVDGDLLCIASPEAAPQLTRAAWESRSTPGARKELSELGLFTLEDLMARCLFDGTIELPAGPKNTDDNGLVEFRAPWELPAFLPRDGSVGPGDYRDADPLSLWRRTGWAGETEDELRDGVEAALRRSDPALAAALSDGWAREGGEVPAHLLAQVATAGELRSRAEREGLPRAVAGLCAEAEHLLAAGHGREAVERLLEAAELVPRSPEVFIRLVEALRSTGRSGEVATLAESTLRRGGRTVRFEALFALGECRAAEGRSAEAEAAFMGAIEADPYREAGYLALASHLGVSGRIGDARRCLERGLSFIPWGNSLRRGLDTSAPPGPEP